MKRLSFLLIFPLVVLVVSCSIAKDKATAEAVAKEVFESIRQKDFDRTVSFYSQKFFEKSNWDF